MAAKQQSSKFDSKMCPQKYPQISWLHLEVLGNDAHHASMLSDQRPCLKIDFPKSIARPVNIDTRAGNPTPATMMQAWSDFLDSERLKVGSESAVQIPEKVPS
jgi:hypothetical protein